MNSKELIKAIFTKLHRSRWIILLGALLFGGLFYFMAKSKRTVYTAKATVFPLTTPTDNSLSNSALNSILGLGDAPKSFSNEATINIIELTSSRNVRQAVASSRLEEFGNKTITELLVEDINQHKGFLSKAAVLPPDSAERAVLGGELLKDQISAKMSKNGVLELYYSHPTKALITPITNRLIKQLSQFYIDLKTKKAQADYDFAVRKIDSLQAMINTVDKQAIKLQNTSYFTPDDRLEFGLPKENLSAEKSRIVRQRDLSVNNREEATWRLQKATPIISVLDQPTEPFTISSSSAIVMALVGLFLGSFLTALVVLFKLIYGYAKSEFQKAVFGK